MRLFEREDYLEKIRGFYHDDGVIKVLTGVRRCGKSCLMQTIAEELRATGVREDHIIYLDLDRYGFRSVKTPDQLEALIEPALKTRGMKYLFIDEIQNVEGFEEVVCILSTRRVPSYRGEVDRVTGRYVAGLSWLGLSGRWFLGYCMRAWVLR